MKFSEKETFRMTIRKFNKLYEYYKFYHDLDMRKITYKQLEEEQAKDDEWLS